jgi:hypothetical protein
MTMRSNSKALSNRAVFVRFLPPVVLVVLMVSFFHLVPQFDIVGEDLLVGGSFEGGLERGPWKQAGKVEWEEKGGWDGSAGVKISVVDKKAGVLGYPLGDPGEYEYLLFRGHLRSEKVVQGTYPWSTARLLLYFRDSNGNALWREPHEVQHLIGTVGWQGYSRVFKVPDDGATAHLSAVSNGASGVLWVDQVEVFPAEESRAFFWWRFLFGGLWLATLMYGFCQIRLWQWELKGSILIVIGVLLLGLLVPSKTISNVAQGEETISGALVKGAKAISRLAKSSLRSKEQPPTGPETPGTGHGAGSEQSAEMKRASLTNRVVLLKEAGHFCLFALLAFLSCLSLNRRLSQGSEAQGDVESSGSADVGWGPMAVRPVLILGLGLIVFSMTTEVLQFLVLTRTPTIRDWLFDLAGICVSLVLFLAYRFFKYRG